MALQNRVAMSQAQTAKPTDSDVGRIVKTKFVCDLLFVFRMQLTIEIAEGYWEGAMGNCVPR